MGRATLMMTPVQGGVLATQGRGWRLAEVQPHRAQTTAMSRIPTTVKAAGQRIIMTWHIIWEVEGCKDGHEETASSSGPC